MTNDITRTHLTKVQHYEMVDKFMWRITRCVQCKYKDRDIRKVYTMKSFTVRSVMPSLRNHYLCPEFQNHWKLAVVPGPDLLSDIIELETMHSVCYFQPYVKCFSLWQHPMPAVTIVTMTTLGFQWRYDQSILHTAQTVSKPCLLMHWLFVSPDHQNSRYQMAKTGMV